MLRIEEAENWKTITHRDHAQLAGTLAREWGGLFVVPDSLERVVEATARHEDGWDERDVEPRITYAGAPAAYCRQAFKERVPFEGIDFPDYLEVRAASADRLKDDPFAASLVSRQTVTALSEEMDLSGLSDREHRRLIQFLEDERARQANLLEALKADEQFAGREVESLLEQGWRLLQVCDRLAQIVCLRVSSPVSLGEALPMVDGWERIVWCEPLGPERYRLIPYPFREPQLQVRVPCRRLVGKVFNSHEAVQEAMREAPVAYCTIRFV